MSWIESVVLTGTTVQLRPLTADDVPALFEASRDPGIWAWTICPYPQELADVESYVAAALAGAERGNELPFVVSLLGSGEVVGSTRYLDIRPDDRNVEIGWTWYRPEVQRTRVNTECKFLLLEHAFERLGAVRVQLKTDARNERSRNAILRIGAQFEGQLRRNKMTHSGFIRDTVYFSILDSEWPDVKLRLQEMLGEILTSVS